ncbi:M24 family metallopeptidase [Celeribacter sp.]|uniref:M24 family metallopeptidase n=1 Tax=Celeribacter sp. TaxID=1890673 RepID=UPI003A93F3A7
MSYTPPHPKTNFGSDVDTRQAKGPTNPRQPSRSSTASSGRHENGHRADQLHRVAKLAEVLRARNIDAAIIDAAEHMRYLFGYSASAVMYQCCIVTADGSAHAIIRELDDALFESASWVTERATYVDWEDPFDLLISEIQRLGLASATIAQELDSNYLTVRDQRRLAAALPDVQFADISGVILKMRARKSPAEIEEHRRAAAIADLGVSAVLDAMAEGVSEGELVAAGYAAALAGGADNNAPRLVLLGMGVTTQHMHGGVGNRRLEVGQPVHIELLPQSNGYSTRVMRPAVLGPLPSNLQSSVEQLAEIQDRQLSAMRPGVPAREIDRLAREELVKVGLRDRFPHNTGYGIGIITGPKLADFAHLFTPAAEWELQQGMVFHMYLSAAGIQISDTICVTENGIEVLTRLPRKLLNKKDV